MTTHFMIHAILKKRSYYKNFLNGYRMKSNAEKCHLIMSSNEPVDFLWGSSIIVKSDFEEILGVKTDYKINFDEYVKNLCSKANNKLKALVRASPYMIVEKKKKNADEFIFSTHSSTTARLSHSLRNNDIIRNVHKRFVRLICNNKNSSYEELLTIDDSVSIHHRNIKAFATDLYKIKNS